MIRLVSAILRQLLNSVVVGVDVTANAAEKRDRDFQDRSEQVLGRVADLTMHLTSKYNMTWGDTACGDGSRRLRLYVADHRTSTR